MKQWLIFCNKNIRSLPRDAKRYSFIQLSIYSYILKFYQCHFPGGYSIDSLLENKESPISIPIPLPVYIRTRSPPGSDVFGKPKRCRRSRTVFTELQLMGLEKRFETQKYLSTPDRMDLAESLGKGGLLHFQKCY